MKKEDLSEEARRKYEELEQQMLKEFEEIIPKTKAALDMEPSRVMREITAKYLPQMLEILGRGTES